MDLRFYTYDGWQPRIRPASPRRGWMDATQESFAYRCLPLAVANNHGWEILSPCGFTAVWNGGTAPGDVKIVPDPGTPAQHVPEALFGHGTITFHVEAIIRSEAGWNLWIGGSPNHAKDGIAPLSGLIETDWSPFTFTMNWRFTRPGHAVRFEENEPIAFFFPVQRGVVDGVMPRQLSIEDDPQLKARFEAWSASRDAFQKEMAENPPAAPADKWQKFYHQGTDATGCPHIADHQRKLRPRPVEGLPAWPEHAPSGPSATANSPTATNSVCRALAKRNWLLGALEDLRALSPHASGIPCYDKIEAEDFLDLHYASNRPALLTGEIAEWPAIRWTAEILKARVGAAAVEYQGGRGGNAQYERDKDEHRATMPFDAFIDLIQGADGNDAYITAYNSARNATAFAPLAQDMDGGLDHLLDRALGPADGMLWIGPAGTFTPLHHDLTNNLLVQIVGTKDVVLVPPGETPKLYNDRHVFSEVQDLDDADLARFAKLQGLRTHRVSLRPGQALFIPVGWWHQVRATSFSVSTTFTNFRWPNVAWESYPPE